MVIQYFNLLHESNLLGPASEAPLLVYCNRLRCHQDRIGNNLASSTLQRPGAGLRDLSLIYPEAQRHSLGLTVTSGNACVNAY